MPVTFLYSTSPSPHELMMVQLAKARRTGTTGPVRIVFVQTADPDPTEDGLHALRVQFCTGPSPAVLMDSAIRNRADAARPETLHLLAEADLILLGGGDPERLQACWAGTPAQQVLRHSWLNGAVIAGCSAGAVVLGAGMITNSGQKHHPTRMWNWLNQIVVAPHYGNYDVAPWRAAYPQHTLLGIPDDAMALIRGPGRVESVGRHPLTVLTDDRPAIQLPPGETGEL